MQQLAITIWPKWPNRDRRVNKQGRRLLESWRIIMQPVQLAAVPTVMEKHEENIIFIVMESLGKVMECLYSHHAREVPVISYIL